MLTRSHRWTLALLTGVCLAVAAVPAPAAQPDKLLPDDTFMVLNIDVRQLISSDVVKKHALEDFRAALKKNAQASEILSVLNFDPEKDLHSITLAVGGGVPLGPGGPMPDALGVIRGKFDLERVHGVLAELVKNKADKVSVSEYGKFKVYEAREGPTPTYVAFADGQTIIVSPKKSLVTDALDRSQGKSTGKLKSAMASALEKADAKQTVWVALNFPTEIKDLIKAQPQAAPIAEKLDSLTAGITVRDNIAAQIGIHLSDAAMAKQLAAGVDQAKQFLGLAAFQNKELGPLVVDIIPTIKATTQDSSVVITAELSPAIIDKLVKAAKEQNKP